MSKKVKLVLSGSGTRFPVFVGALKRLIEESYEFEAICGTSGGAIIGSGLAMGYDPCTDMAEMCKEFLPNLTQYLDPSLFSFFWNWGLIKGDKIEDAFKDYLPGKFSDVKIPLKVITVNYDEADEKKAFHVFGSEETPKISLIRAVRASMSIPLVFAPVKIGGDRHIDGGVSANFPIDIFGEEADNVVGLYMNTNKPIKREKKKCIGGLINYIFDIVDIFINATTSEYIEDAKGAEIIYLDTKYGGLNFFMTEQDIDNMIEEGYNSVNRWLEQTTTSSRRRS